jgi:DNA-binding XRE family transcriptional regulator
LHFSKIEHLCSIAKFFFSRFLHVQKDNQTIFLKALGNRIRLLRIEKGLSQLDLGVLMDNYAEQVSRIERGKFNVTVATLLTISNSLEVSLSELFDFEY